MVLETERLRLRHFDLDDADFIVELLNEAAFKEHIGDKGVRTVEDARQYLQNGPIDSYERVGYGLNMVELRESGEAIGTCGLVRRKTLDDADIGYAILERFRSRGYARESAQAVLAHARNVLGLNRIVAIVTPENAGSIRLLGKLGLNFERMIRLADGDEDLRLFASEVK